MKIIYICSPLRGDIEGNIKAAEGYCRQVAALGHLPIAPHVYFTRFLDDTVPNERECGLLCGLELLRLCHEIWVFGTDEPSEGMAAEIALARELLKPIYKGDLAVKLGQILRDDPDDELWFMPAAATVLGTRETQNALHITYEDGQITKYEKVALTRAWLTMSNDAFFRRFGFNWIPPMWLQEKVQSELAAPQSGIGFGVQVVKQIANTSPIALSSISTYEAAKAMEKATRGLYSALNGAAYD